MGVEVNVVRNNHRWMGLEVNKKRYICGVNEEVNTKTINILR